MAGELHRHVRTPRILTLAMATIVGSVMLSFGAVSPANAVPTTVNFGCTGGNQTWTVPPGVTSATFTVDGAAGGDNNFSGVGPGGRAAGTLVVTPGQVFTIVVGCEGERIGYGTGGFGFGHGGNGGPGGVGTISNGLPGAGGGGGSAVLSGSIVVLVGGGGGGSTPAGGSTNPAGGAGGGINGSQGGSGFSGDAGGGGGTQTQPGAGAVAPFGGNSGASGSGNNGGAGAPAASSGSFGSDGGGGGGGGFFGGGGGSASNSSASAGGGGSGYVAPGVVAGTLTSGIRSGGGQITIGFDRPNTPPVANNDTYTTSEDTALTVAASGVLSNDSDADGNALTTSVVSGPSNGTVQLDTNGSFTYTPTANYSGLDSFTYKANDGTVDSNTATVNITVSPVNDPPSIAIVRGGACGLDDHSALLPLRISDRDNQAKNLIVSATGSSNPALVPLSNIVFAGSGANRTLSATTVAGQIGGTVITVTASDGATTSALTFNAMAGGSTADTLNGTVGTDVIFGMGGNDVLNGLDGLDVLCGGVGVDNLFGGSGADALSGGAGDDFMTGGNGADAFTTTVGDTITDFNAAQGDTK